MFSRFFSVGAAAVAALALASVARAEDTFRLALPGSTDAPTQNLNATDSDLYADTLTVARGGSRGGSRGGFRGGFYGGSRGGFYRGVGYRGFYGYRGIGYRGFYGGYRGFYPRYGYGGYYYPRYGYYPRAYYYAYPAYYYYPAYSYYPCTLDSTFPTMPPAAPSLGTTPLAPAAPPPSGSGTFEYDGGPRAPVPLPSGEEKVIRPPNYPALATDLAVSTKSGKWNYPAYGEKPTRSPRYGIQPSVVVGNLP